MLTEYSISDIIITGLVNDSFYTGTFEDAEDPDINWPHKHDFYTLVWFTNGLGINVIDFEEYKIQPNRLFLTKPGQVHNWSYSNDTSGYIIVFDKHVVQNISLELLNSIYFDLNDTTVAFFKVLIENLIDETKVNNVFSEQMINASLALVLLKLSKLSESPTQNQRIISDEILSFSKLILDNISENLQLKEYADRLNITTEKLNEICKEYYGESPKKIILDKKITESKRLLHYTNLSIKEVAYQLGFEDSSYFARIFKQRTGLSPTNFKRKVPD
jgi:AraC family transcriptional regulator, transcriptional activator of pobA